MVMVFGNTVGVVIIAVMIQRPEKLIDSFTGLCKHSAYADDMKKNFAIRNHVSIIMVNIANYDSLQKNTRLRQNPEAPHDDRKEDT